MVGTWPVISVRKDLRLQQFRRTFGSDNGDWQVAVAGGWIAAKRRSGGGWGAWAAWWGSIMIIPLAIVQHRPRAWLKPTQRS